MKRSPLESSANPARLGRFYLSGCSLLLLESYVIFKSHIKATFYLETPFYTLGTEYDS